MSLTSSSLFSSFLTMLNSAFQDVANEISAELGAKPDLIVGNYSEGNLVASLLAHKLDVTQVCTCHVVPIF